MFDVSLFEPLIVIGVLEEPRRPLVDSATQEGWWRSLKDAGLSQRARTVLCCSGVKTKADVEKLTEDDFQYARNCGPVTQRELREFIKYCKSQK